MIRKVKGTEDILPQTSKHWQAIEDLARDIFANYNYKEIRTPMIEMTDLFVRSVGETTDIVSKEMYSFEDKGGRALSLRPEGTAPVVRAYVEHKLYGPEHANPMKLYYMGPMFRYERPQAGRQRQFHQIGVEVFGSTQPSIDVEAITMAWDFLKELGLDTLTLHINTLGKPKERAAYREALIAYFTPYLEELSEDSKRRLHDNPLRIIDSKDPKDQALAQDAPQIIDFLGEESKKHFEKVQELLQVLEIPFVINHRMVRGLDYYQDTIFEIMVDDDTIGAQSTICGGGRYDGLSQDIGGPEAPGFGFAIGVERLLILLEDQGIDLVEEDELDLFILSLGEEAEALTTELLYAARQAGLNADRDYLGRSIKAQFRAAERNHALLTTVIGENEVMDRAVTLKNQKNGKEKVCEVEDLRENFGAIFRQLTMDTSVIDEYFGGDY